MSRSAASRKGCFYGAVLGKSPRKGKVGFRLKGKPEHTHELRANAVREAALRVADSLMDCRNELTDRLAANVL